MDTQTALPSDFQFLTQASWMSGCRVAHPVRKQVVVWGLYALNLSLAMGSWLLKPVPWQWTKNWRKEKELRVKACHLTFSMGWSSLLPKGSRQKWSRVEGGEERVMGREQWACNPNDCCSLYYSLYREKTQENCVPRQKGSVNFGKGESLQDKKP